MGPGLAINGRPIAAQHIRELTVTAETARAAIRNNGFDEVMVHDDKSGKNFIIASTNLDLSALRKGKPAVLTLDGKTVSLIDYDAENNSVIEGAAQGIRNGWKDLADTTMGSVRTAVGTLGAGGTIAMVGTAVGGSAYYFVKKGSISAAQIGAKGFMKSAASGLATGGLTTMKVIGLAALAGGVVVTVAGAIRGANDAGTLSHAQNFAGISRISIPRGSNMRPTPETPVVAPVVTTVVSPEAYQAPVAARPAHETLRPLNR